MKKLILYTLFCIPLLGAQQKRVLIFGSSSVLTKSLVMRFLDENYQVAVLGSRIDELAQLKRETGNLIYVRRFRAMHDQMREELAQLVQDMSGLPDLILINDSALLQDTQEELEWDGQYKLIRSNIVGYASIIQYFMNIWLTQNYAGHFVSIISTDSTRNPSSMPFSVVSTEFITHLCDEMAQYSQDHDKHISFTTVSSDWDSVKTATYSQDSLDQSVHTIFEAIQNKTGHVQVSQHWHLITMLMKIMPDWLYKAVGGKS